MPPTQKKAVLTSWRSSIAGNGPRFLVVFDVTVKPPDVPWSPLVINFDLPRSVEGYAARAAAAVSPRGGNQGQVNGVIVSFVQAAGGDVEMLRSTECAYRFKVSHRICRMREREMRMKLMILSRRRYLLSSMICSSIEG